MTKEPNPGEREPEQPDPLGATAMFLRVFDQKPPENPTDSKAEPLFASSAPAPSSARTNGPATTPPADPVAGATGEFTRFFRDQADKPSDAAPAASNPAGSTRPLPAGGPPPGRQEQGEFTRLFVKGVPEPAKVSSPQPESFQPPVAPVPAAGGKGFSAPGMSDAASGESSFTQLFKSTPQPPAPFAPTLSAAPAPERRPSASLNFEPIPRIEDTPQSTDQRVTRLIASLGSAPSQAGRQEQEVVPYRVEAQPRSFAPEPKPAPTAQADAGGVTQFIRRLADEPRAPLPDAPAPATFAAAPEVKSGPGEFARMISKAEMDAAIGAAAAAPAPQAAPHAAAAPVVQPIAVAAPHLAVPVPPKIPSMPAAAPPPPVAAAPVLPKIPVPVVPAIPAPKGKLESMVPYLMIVNTFLLLVVLLVLVFLIKAH